MKNKKTTIQFIVSSFIVVAGVLSLITSTSYAILKGSVTDTNTQVIKAGNVELELTENFEDINKKVAISQDADALLSDEYYTFSVKNIGSSSARYELKLINNVPSNYEGNILESKYIKVGLEINGEENGPMSLEKVNEIIDSNVIYENEIINYKLRIWLDSTNEEAIKNLGNYKAFLKLKLEAVQRK